jgi:hypothetical protein
VMIKTSELIEKISSAVEFMMCTCNNKRARTVAWLLLSKCVKRMTYNPLCVRGSTVKINKDQHINSTMAFT